MINERIKLIEDRESMYNLNEESTKNQKSTINFDIFEEKGKTLVFQNIFLKSNGLIMD